MSRGIYPNLRLITLLPRTEYMRSTNDKMATVAHAMEPTVESMSTVTELLWQDALRHLTSTNNEVLLPTNVRDMIGKENVEKIKSRLR